MLRQQLSQKLLQKLSPQQIQLMKLLQVPTAAIESRVKEELEANPALQEGDDAEKEDDVFASKKESEEKEEYSDSNEDIDLSDYLAEDDAYMHSNASYSNYSDDEEEKSVPIATYTSFHEHLLSQLGLLRLDERRQLIAEQIVGSIGDDGYLRREIRAMVNDLAFSQNISTTEEEIEELLSRIQHFEPVGIGARNLQECLLIQLRNTEEEEREASEHLAIRLLEDQFEAFSKKHYEKLLSRLSVTREELRAAIEEILRLNPKPASAYSGGKKINQYIIPDFIINNNDGELKLSLNSRNAPNLQVNESFLNTMKAYKESKQKSKEQKEAVLFIKQKLDSAKWFIDAIKQRQHTLLSTMNTILEYQNDFFLTGDEMTLKPMILKDIADVTGLDISTVSRVANSKYVQTEFGTLPLKYFFSESLQTEDGEEASTREVKRVLQDIIDQEDKKKPYSDQKLMEFLKEKGYNIARRTVAKYREQLNIPVARLRKEI
ncbi:MAG: RNA polymerase factor sigma-54 [Saprospiraceae bacterium]|nr:RNA polymerase factor sigma-54 [Saprospiraceae bacterium]